ncbi:hypothetical protein EDC94DRAFT_586255 [Helicostylum pulchrum]|nr:hypothetical protein EDC94DRAFT_586255 [Helicostylum pulchrum]
MGKPASSACSYATSNTDINDIFNHPDITGYCDSIKVFVAGAGTGIDLYYMSFKETGKILNCMLMEDSPEHRLFIRGASFPRSTAAITTTTTTTTTTKTTIKSPALTCAVGYKGKRNGQGPTKAFCSHSDDCKDTCVNGACNKHP